MIVVFAKTEDIARVEELIAQVDRLNEWVEVKDMFETRPIPSGHALMVRDGDIQQPVDWYNLCPPYILPEKIALTEANLLALVFAKLGNYAQAYDYLRDNALLYNEIDVVNRLQHGIPTDPSVLTSDYAAFEEYRFAHNQAILRHYAATAETFDYDKTRYFYNEAIQSAPNDEYRAYSARHYAILLLDSGAYKQTEDLLQQAIQYVLSDDGRAELKAALCSVWMKTLSPPYDQALLAQLKETLWETLQYYEQRNSAVDVALLLIDASHIANLSNSFTESLNYISRAIDLLRQEELPELLANAQLRRGELLYTWAQQGQPQFYKGALDSYQEALKVFSREEAPDVFANIHHHLGIIYAEIPDEVKKKSIWAAVSTASFQEALNYFTLEDFPYEYAMICNSYGNALTKYPAAVHSDNYEKALYYYQEALNVRSPEAYPLERVLTLFNYLEASWHAGNDTDQFNQNRYEDMLAKVLEIKDLTTDVSLLEEADKELHKLAVLKEVYQLQ